MGVIIAVTICPNGGVWGGRPPGLALYGAAFVVIPERYPQEGARSSRLTAATARNPATPDDGPGVRPGARDAARPGRAGTRSGVGANAAAAGESGPGAVREPAVN